MRNNFDEFLLCFQSKTLLLELLTNFFLTNEKIICLVQNNFVYSWEGFFCKLLNRKNHDKELIVKKEEEKPFYFIVVKFKFKIAIIKKEGNKK